MDYACEASVITKDLRSERWSQKRENQRNGSMRKWRNRAVSQEPRMTSRSWKTTSEWILPEGFQKEHMPASVLILAE